MQRLRSARVVLLFAVIASLTYACALYAPVLLAGFGTSLPVTASFEISSSAATIATWTTLVSVWLVGDAARATHPHAWTVLFACAVFGSVLDVWKHVDRLASIAPGAAPFAAPSWLYGWITLSVPILFVISAYRVAVGIGTRLLTSFPARAVRVAAGASLLHAAVQIALALASTWFTRQNTGALPSESFMNMIRIGIWTGLACLVVGRIAELVALLRTRPTVRRDLCARCFHVIEPERVDVCPECGSSIAATRAPVTLPKWTLPVILIVLLYPLGLFILLIVTTIEMANGVGTRRADFAYYWIVAITVSTALRFGLRDDGPRTARFVLTTGVGVSVLVVLALMLR